MSGRLVAATPMSRLRHESSRSARHTLLSWQMSLTVSALCLSWHSYGLRSPAWAAGSRSDETRASVSTYTAARVLLLDAIHRLRAAAEMAENEALTEQGTHLLLLRPALVSTAKAAWVVGPEDSVERSTRAVRLVCEDHRQGALAMRKAVEQGAPAAFGTVASSFERSSAATLASLRVRSVDAEKKPPRDESLILNLGSEIDRYYGTNDASSDLQLLWNASSCLDHGERHHSILTSRPSRAEVAKILTVRSFDGTCSGVNVTGLRLMGLAVSPAGS